MEKTEKENEASINDNFKRELEEVAANSILTPEFRRKKLILWFIRTTISVVLYIIFWKYNWVKWTLLLTVPLSLFSLCTIVVMPYFLKRKIENTKAKIEETEKIISDINEQ